jgi:serine/threonine-protein kinase
MGSRSKRSRGPKLPRPFGDYVLLHEIGHGGMGEVFLARLRKSGADRLCVVKTLRTDITDENGYNTRFYDEARTT